MKTYLRNQARNMGVLVAIIVAPACAVDDVGVPDDPPQGSADLSSARTVTIPVKTMDGGVAQVQMSNVRGRAMIDDMDFGDVNDLSARSISKIDPDSRWPKATLRYYLELADPVTRLTPTQQVNFALARTYIQTHTPVHVEPVASLTGDYVHVTNDPSTPTSSHAEVGRKGGSQDLVLGAGVNASSVGTIVHELGHSLGLIHEHKRPDRPAFMKYCPMNVTPGKESDFDPLGWGDAEGLTPYDFHSVMHYGNNFVTTTDPTQCGGEALEPLVDTFPDAPGVRTFGSTGIYSAEDFNALSLLYGRSLASLAMNDLFGTSIAIADVDQDSYSDVFVGAPGKQLPGEDPGVGHVFAFKGTARGLAAWKIANEGSQKNSAAGQVLAVADFDGDGFPDVVVGRPGDGAAKSGTVVIHRGGQFATGNTSPNCGAPNATLCPPDREPLVQVPVALVPADCPGQTNNTGDAFGSALAVGDFDGDNKPDLVIGAPGKVGANGRVFVYSGASLGPAIAGSGTANVKSVMLAPPSQKGPAAFGTALAIGDYNFDGKPDLAVGAPNDVSGAVYVFNAVSASSFTGVAKIVAPSGVVAGDGFGSVLLAPRLGGATQATFLAVSSPRTRLGAGEVDLFVVEKVPTFFFSHRQQITAGSFAGGFGSALASFDFDDDKVDDLVIGAPTSGSGKRGSVEMMKSDSNVVAFWNKIVAPTDTALFGAALATGKIHGPQPPSVTTPDIPTRLLVGSPGYNYLGALPNVGRFYGYAMIPGPAQREIISESWTDQFVVD